jgi:NAD(P)-dependent dehydrogenase (short-subunit alcohol dehydrogenase family)
MEIKDKVVIVTGAGGTGCGRAIARRFARDGAAVVVSDIHEEGARETVAGIESEGGRAVFFHGDVRVEEQVRGLIEFAEKTFGGLDVLVNNASAPFRPDEPLEHWVDTLQTDLAGTMYGTRFAIDAMRRKGGGAIVNISSISALWHGREKGGGTPAYDMAKSGSLRLTTGLAWLGEKEHIRVNCFAPGWIATDPVRTYWETLTPAQRLDRGVPARLLQLEEVSDAVVRLARDESLFGRVLVWWSDDSPGLIPWGDRGYGELQPLPMVTAGN